MQQTESRMIYDELGVTPIINALGHRTVLGGSSLSPTVRAAMDDANRYFVDMTELLDRSGEIIAGLLGAEAAYVTPGAAAALTLGAAACIADNDPSAIAQLPDVTGLRHEIVIQSGHRYKYDRCVTIVGARLREAGDARGTTSAQLEASISERTAAILFPAHLDGQNGTVSLAEVIVIARRHGVPVLVDAAYQVYPIERLKSFTRIGADLVAIASKYFGGPNSAGFLIGRKGLVTSAAQQGFIGFESAGNNAFGRPLKLDRQEIVAVVVALREWLAMDHEARLRGYEQKLRTIAQAVDGLLGVTYDLRPFHGPEAIRLHVRFGAESGHTAGEVAMGLRRGRPSILVDVEGEELIVAVPTVHDGDEQVIADRLRELVVG